MHNQANCPLIVWCLIMELDLKISSSQKYSCFDDDSLQLNLLLECVPLTTLGLDLFYK